MTRSGTKRHRGFGTGLVGGAWYAAALVLLALGVMGYLWPQHRIVELGYRLEELESRRAKVERLHRMISLEAASLASLPRIEQIATTQLGMVFPMPDQVRTVHHHPEGG
ncbi:MAG: cell division protein FtsL [bacterium]|jgi:cell division protein FtsL|nr:cell division protein FtsL [bacterium]